MAEFVRYIDLPGPDTWPVQVVQDAFAYGEAIPLRMLRLGKLRDLWAILDNESACRPIRDLFTNRADFESQIVELVAKHGYVEDNSPNETLPSKFHVAPLGKMKAWTFAKVSAPIAEALDVLESILWVTRPSNQFLLFQEFRQSVTWRLWELLWVYHHCAQDDRGTYDFRHAFGIPSLLLTGAPVAVQQDTILFAGPMLEPSRRHTGGDVNDQRVQPAIQRHVQFLSDDVSEDRQDRMTLASQFRMPITMSGIRSHLARLVDAFGTLGSLELTRSHRTLRQCDHASLAEWVLFLTKWRADRPRVESSHESQEQTGPNHALSTSLFFRFDHSLGLDGDKLGSPSSKKAKTERTLFNWIEWPIKSKPLRLHSTLKEPVPEHFLLSNAGFVAASRMASGISLDYLNMLEDGFFDFSAQSYSQKVAHETEQLAMTREWLNELFGNLTTFEPQPAENGHFQRKLCKRIIDIVGSDSVNLYRYDYTTRILRPEYLHFADPHIAANRDQEGDVVIMAGGDSPDRNKSICYRAIDFHKQLFTRMYDPVTGTSDPDNQPLLPAPKGLPSMRSAIAAPITIFGRPWGVLELNGTRPYQFRWADLGLANQITRTISQFLYHQELLSHLHNINNQIFGEMLQEQEALNAICKHLASIFMSQGASLWLRDPNNQLRYVCKGVHNRSDIKQQILRDPQSVWFQMDDVDSFSAKVISGESFWMQFRPAQDALRDAWQKFIPHPSPIPMPYGCDHLTVIRIASQRGGAAIATLSLYNTHPIEKCYSDDWEGLFKFVTGNVALLLEAIRTQQNMERTRRLYIEHEIKQRIRILKNRGTLVSDLQRRAKKGDGPNRLLDSRFEVALDDVIVYSRMVAQTLDMLSEKEFTAALRAGSNPIIAHVEKLKAEIPSERVDFNATFQSAVGLFFEKGRRRNNRSSTLPQIALELDPEMESIRLNLHAYSFHTILDNLLSNAIKYARDRSGSKGFAYDVKVSLIKLRNGAKLTFRNISPSLEEGEEFRLCLDGVRSLWAKKTFPHEGEGKGLFLIKSICELYGIEFNYMTEPLDTPSPQYCWHCPTLIIPDQLLIRVK